MKKNILGIHYGHDATVVYIKDNEIVEAMSEERLSRQKKHLGFPHKSLSYIKKKYNISNKDLEEVYVVGENPAWDSSIFVTEDDNKKIRSTKVKYKDHLYSLQFIIPGLSSLLDLYYSSKSKITNSDTSKKVTAFLGKEFPTSQIKRISHHKAHAWAVVPFIEKKESKHLIFTLDGGGDNISGSVSIFENGSMNQIKEISLDASLGLLYNSIVDILGMKKNEHEFKVMGLAPYAKASQGEVVYQELKKIFWFDSEDFTFKSSIPTIKATAYFIANNYHRHRFDSLAYGIQKLTEECIKDLVLSYVKKYDIPNVALGGGVFMNVKANQRLLELEEIKTLTIAPSCGDESLAIGAAVYGFVQEGSPIKNLLPLKNLYLGSDYSDNQIKNDIDSYVFKNKIKTTYYNPKESPIEKEVAKILAENNVVGRFKERAEWGARALGNRSILANPSSRETVKLINEMIKGRDFWMPFATSLLYEDSERYLVNEKKFFAPYMSITFNTHEKATKELPAALHPYDLTSRPQMVTEKMNNSYHFLISEYKKITDSSGILNTSFNLHGEPNVENPTDALRTFDLSGLKYLAIGNYLVEKIAN